MYTYAMLGITELLSLYNTYLDAFSDYPVRFNLSPEGFQNMLQRRGFVPTLSLGAFPEGSDKPVAFMLNALRDWQGKRTAYDLMTGTAPAHRKRGITGQLLEKALGVLAENGAEQYLLEVLQNNETAFRLYQKQGFSVERSFSCFSKERGGSGNKTPAFPTIRAEEFQPDIWDLLRGFWDFHPSWQNSIDSVQALGNAFAYVSVQIESSIVGYGIVDKATGDIPQLAVAKEWRGKGIGGSILAALEQSTSTGAPELKVINVEDGKSPMESFLRKNAFQKTAAQYEMLLPLKGI